MSQLKPSTRRWSPFLLMIVLIGVILYASYRLYHAPERPEDLITQRKTQEPIRNASYVPLHSRTNVAVVVAKSPNEDVGWIHQLCANFGCIPYIYTLAEVPEPEYFAARSSIGREANGYLSYIVDHYDDLHRYTIFLHAKADNWHNDVGGSKTYDQLPNLRFEAIEKLGYVNLRCLVHPGCPNSLFPGGHDATDTKYQNLVDNFPRMYSQIFGVNESSVPREIGHQCCAQFAVTKDVIRNRPLVEYRRMLDWVTTTPLADSFGVGWVMEKLWHVVFGMQAV